LAALLPLPFVTSKVVNCSAMVGWIPIVASNSAFVAPHLPLAEAEAEAEKE
jgi:hypothetical protein